MRIPQIAFAIWYGGMLPKNAQENLIKLKQLNPDYDVRLISDPNTMADEDYGLLVTVYDPTMKVAESVGDIDILISLNYDFIIAAPKLNLFREALLAHQQDQEYFQSLDDNLLFQESSSRQGLRAYVIATTGSLLFYCLTQFLSQNMASIKQNQDILIASTIVDRDNDNSWLPNDFSPLTLDEIGLIIQCINQLHSQRVSLFDKLDSVLAEDLKAMIIAITMPSSTRVNRNEWKIPRYPHAFNLQDFRRTLEQQKVRSEVLQQGFFAPQPPPLPKITVPTFDLDFKPVEIHFDISAMKLPALKVYTHRYGFLGKLSPGNIYKNLANDVPWDATTTQRDDILERRIVKID